MPVAWWSFVRLVIVSEISRKFHWARLKFTYFFLIFYFSSRDYWFKSLELVANTNGWAKVFLISYLLFNRKVPVVKKAYLFESSWRNFKCIWGAHLMVLLLEWSHWRAMLRIAMLIFFFFSFFFLEMEVSNFKKKTKAPKNIKLKYRQKTLVIDATTSHLTLLKIRNKITCKSFSYCYPR